jgi:hypothetical protein
MSEFDDPQMERLLGQAGGAHPDVNSAYSRVQGRVRVIRRRRAVVAGTAACVLIAGGALFAAGRGGSGRANLGPAAPSTVADTTSVSSTTPESAPTTDGITGATVAGGGQNGESGQGGQDAQDTSTTMGEASTTTAPSTPAPATSAPTATAPAPGPVTLQYDSVGGSITVKLDNGALSLVSATPAGGFHIDSATDRADRVEVRFRSDTHDSRIRIDLVDGSPVPQISEN